MKTEITTLLTIGIMAFTGCTKENSNINTDESSKQAFSSEDNVLAGTNAVKIGTQVWMKRDLIASYYRNGDKITQVKDPAKWAALTTGAWCWYDNNPAMGKLYNWYAVNDPRGLAPAGWHIPSNEEWTTLSTYLGGEYVAGGKLKEAGTTHWLAPNTGATNSTGFTALPGGDRNIDGAFGNIGSGGFFWSSTESNTSMAVYLILDYTNSYLEGPSYFKQTGFSVRCIKD
ncbi:MAG TPA: fibrobacter succinogenes major paralogous domain-containing protein [Panacibacter sp.]|nr:fibrobacter succinogenes major paralogous domain-containing protein [Panacibacter sp.]